SIFCVVDLHALTAPYDVKNFKERIFDLAATLLASGLNPEKCVLFIQSQAPQHTEMTWFLNTITPVGELERMTQFKEKSNKYRESVNMGLFDYPVLMAADILLYDTEAVPVGEDQRQHVELARVIARKFNKRFSQTFLEPEALIQPEGARIMSLSDPAKKMSKSDDSESYIAVSDEPEVIRDKIKKAVTDSGREIKYDPESKPAISNLLTIFSQFDGRPIREIEKEFQGKSYSEFKTKLAEAVILGLKPLREKRKELLKNPEEIQKILNDGAKKPKKIAAKKIKEVKKKMGLI
ncbi:MAG: tryptophan--tRNA ligase, partial [bacterium]|nr:tryptophan--tRNA ligase [bacterium]